LARKDAAVRAALGDLASAEVWFPPVASPQSDFRNKAKMVVSGTAANPVLGLPFGVSLTDCPLYLPPIRAAFPAILDFIRLADLQPYDLTPALTKTSQKTAAHRGELKNVIVTCSPSNDLMIQFVLRSRATEARIRSKLPNLQEQLPNLRVVSLNIHPEHKAVVQGGVEIVLSDETALPFHISDELTLYVGPQSFFQTNTYIASRLYAQATSWLSEVRPSTIWDLYCGIGGFAMAVARPGRQITGVEISGDAISNANKARDALVKNIPNLDLTFRSEDATLFANTHSISSPNTGLPDAVIVNPPRRGLGTDLVQWLNKSGIPTILYSSCNPTTLAKDISELPNYQIVKAQLFDMFPNTTHSEVLTLLTRR
jgi:23S rRNA (uracil747-C5)-methyltransferase